MVLECCLGVHAVARGRVTAHAKYSAPGSAQGDVHVHCQPAFRTHSWTMLYHSWHHSAEPDACVQWQEQAITDQPANGSSKSVLPLASKAAAGMDSSSRSHYNEQLITQRRQHMSACCNARAPLRQGVAGSHIIMYTPQVPQAQHACRAQPPLSTHTCHRSSAALAAIALALSLSDAHTSQWEHF